MRRLIRWVSLLFLILVTCSEAVVSENLTTSSSSCESCNSLTFSHTVTSGCTNALIIVSAVVTQGATVSSSTYAAAALTLKLAQDSIETWYKVAPVVGSAQNVVITPNTPGVDIIGAATSFCGVDQATPTGTTVYNSSAAQGTPLSTTATVPANGMAIGHMFLYDSTAAATTATVSGGTQRWNIGLSVFDVIGVGQTRSTTGAMDYAFNGGASVKWGSIITPINAAALAGTSIPRMVVFP